MSLFNTVLAVAFFAGSICTLVMVVIIEKLEERGKLPRR